MNARTHFLEIARCPVMEDCLTGADSRHPCAKIVLQQWRDATAEERAAHWRQVHELPEPWQGHLAEAPILFVSSNPSISGRISSPVISGTPEPATSFRGRSVDEHPSIRYLGQGPKWTWDDDALVDRYESSFDVYVKDGIKSVRPDGTTSRFTMFWSAVKKRAQELIPDRAVRPGWDYALTEVVRCKSRKEVGVPEALVTCSSRYFTGTLEAAGAKVLVVLGRHAAAVMHRNYGVPAGAVVAGPVPVADRERMVAFLPHPSAFAARTFRECASADELTALRSWLRHDDGSA